jgi:hypothetical protein
MIMLQPKLLNQLYWQLRVSKQKATNNDTYLIGFLTNGYNFQ